MTQVVRYHVSTVMPTPKGGDTMKAATSADQQRWWVHRLAATDASEAKSETKLIRSWKHMAARTRAVDLTFAIFVLAPSLMLVALS